MCLFILVASFYIFDLSELSKNNVDLCLLVFINSIVALQMSGSVLILSKTIRRKLGAKKNKVAQDDIKFEVVLNCAEDDRSEEFKGIHGGVLMMSPISSAENKAFFDHSCSDSVNSKLDMSIF